MSAPDSFEFAKATVTQLITLATGVIGVSVTFSKDISVGVTARDRFWLFSSWIALLLSVLAGVWTMMALTGTVVDPNVLPGAIYNSNIAIPCFLQVVTFVVGVGMLILHATR